MTSITVKNIPGELYEMLKQSAARSHRSLNSEIIACLERSLRNQPMDPEQFIAAARQLREKTASYTIRDNDFDHAKETGRP